MPPRYRLALFDFDGTLADSYPAFAQALQQVVREQRLRPITPAELEAHRGGHGRVLMRRLGVHWWQLPRVSRAMLTAMTAARGSVRLFPGIEAALRELHARGVRIAVVSSNAEANVRAVLGPLCELVDHHDCGAAVFGKQARLRHVLRRLRVAPAQAVAVGDELRDHEAARGAGVDFVAVGWGYTRPAALQAAQPALLLHSPADLVPALSAPAACSSAAAPGARPG